MSVPLADALRPQKIEDMVGQGHLLGENRPLRKIIESGEIPYMIFYGPSGTGKTTLASIIARRTDKTLHRLNCTTASTSDIRDIVAELGTLAAPNGVLLYLDEIQYFNKKQQQSLLEFIENGKITLIASTTENPYFYVYSAVLSRSNVFEFKTVGPEEIVPAILRAFKYIEEQKQCKISADEKAVYHIACASGGDVRRALNIAESAALCAQYENGMKNITLSDVCEITGKGAMRYDRDGDSHYDILSAFQKSLRGSDPDAAVHYLARLLEADDLAGACRRLMVCACEDVGLAFPQIIPIVKAAVDAAFQVGLPEARIPLADAVILVATSPKSNSGINAIDAALSDIRNGKIGDIPAHLKDSHYSGAAKLGRGLTYQYPHMFENHYVKQQYLPDEIKDRVYYEFGDNKIEQAAKSYSDKIKEK